LKKDNAVLEKQILDLKDQCDKLQAAVKAAEEDAKKHPKRHNSMGSDDDYHSVQDMRDNLKHARAMLI
jgi:phage shock protein A|tara:strand:+ start:120 stop:323 length:204 start_codon:yes stop_codon:yes gene_type:complete